MSRDVRNPIHLAAARRLEQITHGDVSWVGLCAIGEEMMEYTDLHRHAALGGETEVLGLAALGMEEAGDRLEAGRRTDLIPDAHLVDTNQMAALELQRCGGRVAFKRVAYSKTDGTS